MNYIKLMRVIKDKAFYSKDSEKVHLWIHLLLTANWTDKEEMLGGKPILCKAGQFTTGRKQLSIATGINESKIERLLTYFEKIEQQIEQQKTSTNRLISILNWDKYQQTEQQIEQRVNNNRTTGEQRVNTLKEDKEDKKDKEVIIIKGKKEIFNFHSALSKLNIDDQIINDWLIVRKNKKMSNTETSFKLIKNEIEKSNYTANFCIEFAVKKSWGGFEFEWMNKEIEKNKIQNNTSSQTFLRVENDSSF